MYDSTREAVTALLAQSSVKDTADALGVNITHVYRARRGDYTPTLLKALTAAELIPEPPRRRRYHFTLSETDEQLFLEWRKRGRFTERDIGDLIMWEMQVDWWH